jgi:glycerol-3-phosphate acyltransferase PlsY
MWELGVKTLLAYLLGTLLGSLVLGRLRGVDIRSQGSGNAGATNAMRTQGMVFGLVVLLIDVLKGAVAAAWLPFAHLPGVAPDVDISREWLSLACGAAVILGHIYPVWFGFRGGKGVATVVGVVGALQPHLLLPLILSWFAVVLLTGYVGLASMLAGVTLVVTVYVQAAGMSPLLLFCLGVTLLVIYTHRGNVARMRAGTENRARRLWLFRPRAAS